MSKQHSMHPQVNDYAIITSKSDQRTKRNEIMRSTGKAGKDFEVFVSASINWFYGESDHNINVINDLLVIATQSKGYNVQRLASYLKRIIPHTLLDGGKDLTTRFDRKIEGRKYPKADKVAAFLTSNPSWSKTGKSKKAADYDQAKYINSVLAKIEKNGGNVIDFTNALLIASQTKAA